MLLAVAGCSHPAKTTAASSPSPSPAATSASPSPAAPTSPAGPVTHALGETVSFDIASATVYSYKQPVAAGAPTPDQDGYVWGAVDLKVCAIHPDANTQTAYVNQVPWSLVYADSTLAQPSSVGYRQFPQPEYPSGDTTIAWGQCIRGWITFPVPAKSRPTMVEYHPEASPTIVFWRTT